MKLIAVNGSPRKHWNTAQLLEKVVAGAKDAGMDAQLVHLYDLDFQGCTSCFACKRLGSASYGRCAMRDGLTSLLNEIHNADALVFGTPVYLCSESSGTRAFLERVVFPYLTYTNPPGSLFPRRIRTAGVYTMGVPEDLMAQWGYEHIFGQTSRFMEMVFGSYESLYCNDTLQFDDYSRYESSRFDPEAKKRRHEEVFPQDLAKAYELGRRLAEPVPNL